MTELEKENLALARECFKQGYHEKGLDAYAIALSENLENAEALYFCNYEQLVKCINERNGVGGAYTSIIASLQHAINYVAASDIANVEKLEVVKAIVDTYTPLVPSVITSRTITTNVAIEKGVISLYMLGTYIKNEFNSDSEAMKLAIIPWKEAVKQQRKFHAYKYEGNKAEDYVAEIQKIDPAYTMPQKAGCISKA